MWTDGERRRGKDDRLGHTLRWRVGESEKADYWENWSE